MRANTCPPPQILEEEEEEDGKELLADCEFTLAYGTKILLHNTKLKLKRGNRYGLLGGNDSGETPLIILVHTASHKWICTHAHTHKPTHPQARRLSCDPSLKSRLMDSHQPPRYTFA